MLLIQVNAWDGPSMERIARGDDEEPTQKVEAWASRLSANDALLLLNEYEGIFRRRYPSRAVNFNLVGLQEVPELSAKALDVMRVQIVEDAVAALRAELNE